MNEVEVKVGCLEKLERLLDGSSNVAVLGAPKLGRDEDLLARNATLLDSLSNFGLVAVDPSLFEGAKGVECQLSTVDEYDKRQLTPSMCR